MVSGDAGTTRPKKTTDERKEILSLHIGGLVARGRRVESQSDFQAVLIHGQQLNHVLHLLISVFTCGLWLIIWGALAIFGGEKREIVKVDEWGNTSVAKV